MIKLTVGLLIVALLMGCSIIQQGPINVGMRESFFEGSAVAAAAPALRSQLSQASIDCASHLNVLRSKANTVYVTKNVVSSLGSAGAGAGGAIGVADSKAATAGEITAISGAVVAALTQIVTTSLVDPVATKDLYGNDYKWWSDAEESVDASKFSQAIMDLQSCIADIAYPVQAAPSGVIDPSVISGDKLVPVKKTDVPTGG